MPSSAKDVTGRVAAALDALNIELPSWGFANTGTRFGKYLQPAAAVTTAEKIADAGFVHQLTGSCPAVALHVQWDFPHAVDDADSVHANLPGERRPSRGDQPNLFQDQEYKHGSFGNRRLKSANERWRIAATAWRSRAGWAVAICLCGLPMARIIRVRRTSGPASAGSRNA
jgi:L-rhamnose isomerase